MAVIARFVCTEGVKNLPIVVGIDRGGTGGAHVAGPGKRFPPNGIWMRRAGDLAATGGLLAAEMACRGFEFCAIY